MPLLAVAMLLLAGCDSVAKGPTPCDEHYPAARCQSMADDAAGRLHIKPDDIVSIGILPEPTPEIVNGQQILQTVGGARSIRVQVTLPDGSTREIPMCGGIPSGPACTNDPHITFGSVYGPGSGYHDVPCAGEPPDGCAKPLPSIEAKAALAARPIVLDRLVVPIDHVGAYEVPVGEGSLPNGILTNTEFTLADDWPDDLSITDGSIGLDVRSLEPDGKPFHNYYDHGWRPGTERIRAVLVFSVTRFQPGALLDVRGIFVK